jgi:ABC-type branched-subunit amino acid transport system substrate-binding protein
MSRTFQRLFLLGLSITIVALLVGCKSSAKAVATPKASVAKDPKAEDLFRLGNQYFRLKNYSEAASSFAQAAQRPLHSLTTVCLYLQGLSHQLGGARAAALEAYQRLQTQYPQSQYVAEASYHKALLLIEQPTQREAALWLLLNLAEGTSRPELKKDATAAADHFLFHQADIEFLAAYSKKVRGSWRPRVVEALALKLHQSGAAKELARVLDEYSKEATLTPTMLRLKGKLPTAAGTREQLRVAVVLPFRASLQDSTVDETAAVTLQLVQGMRLALDSLAYPGLSDVEIKVLDSEDDSLSVLRLVQSELVPFEPHVVIGDLRNRSTRALASAAQRYGWLHLVPLSDSDELLSEKSSTLLMNPSQRTAASALGAYVRRMHPASRVLVVNDASGTSRRLADSFISQIAGTDIRIRTQVVPAYAALAIDKFKDISASLRVDSVDVVYMPIHNEEFVSFALFRLSNDSANVQVIGIDRWRGYSSLDPQMLTRLHAIMPDLYGEASPDAAFDRFRSSYLRAFKALPTVYAIQGYDLMRVVLTAIGRSSPDQKPEAAVLGMRPIMGLNKSYRFVSGSRDNQAVPLIEFRDGVAVKLPFGQ